MVGNFKIAPLFSLNEIPKHKEIWELLSKNLEKFLTENRLYIFCSGPVLDNWFKLFPKDSLWMKEKIREGRIEFLAGSYDDILPPFFH